MKKKLISVLSCVILFILLCSGVNDVLSSGAPVGSTGAPGENTCAKSGCHDGIQGAPNVNTGNGVVNVTHNIPNNSYQAGQVYEFTVSLQQNNIDRFGYSFTMLDENNNKAGTFQVVDSIRTQIFKGNLQFSGREYMTYRHPGTDPFSPHLGLWTFKWKAPEQDLGKLNVYVAAVSANNDGSDNGDEVYTYSSTINSLISSVADVAPAEKQLRIFPNPCNEKLHFSVDRPLLSGTEMKLLDVAGKVVRTFCLFECSQENGSFSYPIEDVPQGKYILQFETEGQGISSTVLISR